MIIGEHTRLRFCEADDTFFVWELYHDGVPRAALLDGRRERSMPLRGEVREILKKSEAARALLFTVEDDSGVLRGWCGLRGLNSDARFAEVFLVFSAAEDYQGALAADAMAYLLERAFLQAGLVRVVATCLDHETDWRDCLARAGFVSCGIQREVLFCQGTWKHLETLELSARAFFDAPASLLKGKST